MLKHNTTIQIATEVINYSNINDISPNLVYCEKEPTRGYDQGDSRELISFFYCTRKEIMKLSDNGNRNVKEPHQMGNNIFCANDVLHCIINNKLL